MTAATGPPAGAALTAHRAVIHYRDCASLTPKGRAKALCAFRGFYDSLKCTRESGCVLFVTRLYIKSIL